MNTDLIFYMKKWIKSTLILQKAISTENVNGLIGFKLAEVRFKLMKQNK